MPRPLPPDFAWYTPTYDRMARSLRVSHEWGMEVAYVNLRADCETWLSTVNRHNPDWRRRPFAVALSCETAMRWASCWAAARAERLRAAAVERERPRGKWVAFTRDATLSSGSSEIRPIGARAPN